MASTRDEPDSITWDIIAQLRETNRRVYAAIENLVGQSAAEDKTLGLMRLFYRKHPALARAVHRDILSRDRLISDHSAELACES